MLRIQQYNTQNLFPYVARDRQIVIWYIVCQMVVSAIEEHKARKGKGMREFVILIKVVRENIANKDGI